MNKKKTRYIFQAFSLAASLGLHLAACIIVGLLAGKFADAFFGTQPLLTAFGIVIGILAGLWGIYKKIINFEG